MLNKQPGESHYGWGEAGPKPGEFNNHKPKKWGVKAIYSDEKLLLPSTPSTTTTSSPSFRPCDGKLGTLNYVVATFGNLVVQTIVDDVIRETNRRSN